MTPYPLADYLVEKYLGRESIAGRVLSRENNEFLVHSKKISATVLEEVLSDHSREDEHPYSRDKFRHPYRKD